MANPWFKFYGGDYLNDPKFLGMDGNSRSCWVTLLSYASVSEHPGKVKHLTESHLMIQSGIAMGGDEWRTTEGVLKRFEEKEMIRIDNGMITVLNWEKRQETSLTSYQRVKKFREKKRSETEMITTEEIRRDKKRIQEVALLPDWLDKKVWENWVEYRKEKKKSLTQRSIDLQLKELGKNVSAHKAVIEQSIRNGWTGLFPLKEEPKKYSGPPERKYAPELPKVALTAEQEAEKKKGLAMLRDKFSLKK